MPQRFENYSCLNLPHTKASPPSCRESAHPGSSPPAAPHAWYSLAVTTADTRGASTGAEVRVALEGERASSGAVVLPGGEEAFSRGRTDTFRLGWGGVWTTRALS